MKRDKRTGQEDSKTAVVRQKRAGDRAVTEHTKQAGPHPTRNKGPEGFIFMRRAGDRSADDGQHKRYPENVRCKTNGLISDALKKGKVSGRSLTFWVIQRNALELY